MKLMTSPQYSCVVKIFLIVVWPHFVGSKVLLEPPLLVPCCASSRLGLTIPSATESSGSFSQPVPVQRHAVDTAYHIGGHGVDDPKPGIVRVLYIAIGRWRTAESRRYLSSY